VASRWLYRPTDRTKVIGLSAGHIQRKLILNTKR